MMSSKREAIDLEIADFITNALSNDIKKYGEASLLVSGGSTPVNLFDKLSQSDISWDKVNISLVDERFVPDNHSDQNGAMVKSLLLKNKAAKATFYPLITNIGDIEKNLQEVRKQLQNIKQPFSVIILGMGEDGHTASLFPDCDELDEGMSLDTNQDLITTTPTKAPHQRITFTRKAILNTSNLILHCYGNKKKQVLDSAKGQNEYRPYPIQAFIHQDEVRLNIFWAE